MIVHVNYEDLNFLLAQLTTDLEGIEDQSDPFLRYCEKLIERIRRKIDQAKAREDRRINRELIKENEKSVRRFRLFVKDMEADNDAS